jgi:hypothetical protein
MPCIPGEYGPQLEQIVKALNRPSTPTWLIALFSAFVGASFALVFNSLLEFIKARIAKQPLLDLFITDLALTWKRVEHASKMPLGTGVPKMHFVVRGIDGLAFRGDPELEFEVYNVKLYETEGFKLAASLRAETRHAFWAAYATLRDAETARLVLKKTDKNDPDRTEFEKLYQKLLARLDPIIPRLNENLAKERFIYRRPFGPLT